MIRVPHLLGKCLPPISLWFGVPTGWIRQHYTKSTTSSFPLDPHLFRHEREAWGDRRQLVAPRMERDMISRCVGVAIFNFRGDSYLEKVGPLAVRAPQKNQHLSHRCPLFGVSNASPRARFKGSRTNGRHGNPASYRRARRIVFVRVTSCRRTKIGAGV